MYAQKNQFLFGCRTTSSCLLAVICKTIRHADCAYHILKGTLMDQCRYLFALSCYQMDLLNEAEAALSPNEAYAEVPNGAAGHYLLGHYLHDFDSRNISKYPQIFMI
ncbi:hypothetical protein ACS0TY_004723 [Phlomoides rotata]